MAGEATPAAVLDAMPHRPPFRFIDEILELDDEHIVAAYRFPADADFYRGHFPGNPVTPGVLLLEAMAQAGVVAHGIYLVGRDAPGGPPLLTLFTDATVEFTGMVGSGRSGSSASSASAVRWPESPTARTSAPAPRSMRTSCWR